MNEKSNILVLILAVFFIGYFVFVRVGLDYYLSQGRNIFNRAMIFSSESLALEVDLHNNRRGWENRVPIQKKKILGKYIYIVDFNSEVGAIRVRGVSSEEKIRLGKYFFFFPYPVPLIEVAQPYYNAGLIYNIPWITIDHWFKYVVFFIKLLFFLCDIGIFLMLLYGWKKLKSISFSSEIVCLLNYLKKSSWIQFLAGIGLWYAFGFIVRPLIYASLSAWIKGAFLFIISIFAFSLCWKIIGISNDDIQKGIEKLFLFSKLVKKNGRNIIQDASFFAVLLVTIVLLWQFSLIGQEGRKAFFRNTKGIFNLLSYETSEERRREAMRYYFGHNYLESADKIKKFFSILNSNFVFIDQVGIPFLYEDKEKGSLGRVGLLGRPETFLRRFIYPVRSLGIDTKVFTNSALLVQWAQSNKVDFVMVLKYRMEPSWPTNIWPTFLVPCEVIYFYNFEDDTCWIREENYDPLLHQKDSDTNIYMLLKIAKNPSNTTNIARRKKP